jgi:hypothetical protein
MANYKVTKGFGAHYPVIADATFTPSRTPGEKRDSPKDLMMAAFNEVGEEAEAANPHILRDEYLED